MYDFVIMPDPTLSKRLGGAHSIAGVIGGLVDRVMTDARLNKNIVVGSYGAAAQ